jgi:hypothetical protein
MTVITRFAKLLTATFVLLCAIPHLAHAINKCSPSNVFATQNLGLVTQNPYTVHPTGDPQASPTSTTLTFSGPGAFSIQVAFSYEPACPEELYEVTFTGTFAYTTSVLPRYQVLSVYYAPPGAKSTATYGSNYLQSTNNSFSNTFSVANQVSVGVSSIAPAGNSGTVAVGWSQSETTSDSIAVSTTTSESLVIPGPSSSANGIDHTQDLIYVWLNPALTVDVVGGSTPVEVTAVNYDSTDPDQGMDIYLLSVAQLNVLAAGGTPVGVDMTRLARAWSPTGALTPADYQSILAADPFATNPNYNPAGLNRFDSLEQTINYEPAGSGGQPITTPYTSTLTTTSTAGQSATDMHSVEVSVAGSIPIAVADIDIDLKAQTTWTWTNMWSVLQTSTTGQTANFSIVSPLPTDGYTGPTAIGVYKDNVYGTFMFYGEL